MNFQGLIKVEKYQTYLDTAFRNGASAATKARVTKIQDRLKKSKHIERTRIESVSKSLINSLDAILRKFPRLEELDPFYHELVKCTLDYGQLRKSLGALNWAKKQITTLTTQYKRNLAKTTQLSRVNTIRQAFSGRISSVIKQIKQDLSNIEEARKIMKRYPALKTGRNTIVIAGAPNVGKSTLLAVLTGSKPETATYPFTTKHLNLGYDAKGNQYIDTPGLLDRPLAKRNPIERQAILSLNHLADVIVFVFDPTETCGYTLKEQQKLLNDIKQRFDQPIIIASNKADEGATYKHAVEISAKTGKGIEELRKKINGALRTTQTPATRQQ